MKPIEILTTINPADILEIQQYYASQGSFGVDEVYFSPDKQHSLHLHYKYELRGGPTVYKAKMVSETFNIASLLTLKKINLERKTYSSLGQYGIGYTYWSGNPWSNDSKHVSLIELNVNKVFSTLCIVDIGNMDVKRIIQVSGNISHYMWAPNDRYYLFRDMHNLYVYNISQEKYSLIYTGNGFQKHCCFASDDKIIFIDDALNVQVANPETLSIENVYSISSVLEESERIDYSIWDPFNNIFYVGIDFYTLDGGFAKCKRWIGISQSNISKSE